MASFNKLIFMGNLTRDPELKYLPSQTAVCDFTIASNRTWTDKDGGKKEEVMFLDFSAFGKQAEVIAKYKKKGEPLLVEARLRLETWEKDGQKRSKVSAIVENFQFLGGGKSQDDGDSTPPAPASRATQSAIKDGMRNAAGKKVGAGISVPVNDAPPEDDSIPF